MRKAARCLGGIQAEAGFTDETAIQWLMDALPNSVKDWVQAASTAAWGLAKGREEPIILEDRPRPHKANGAAPPPPPPPNDDDDPDSRPGPDAAPHETASKFYNPWMDPPPPPWPGGVLSDRTERTIAEMSLRDGIDFSALAIAHIAAASGAAPKNARFAPYPSSGWSVPPIIWVMLLAESGQRKSGIIDNAFDALRRVHGGRWAEYATDMKRWHTLSDDEKRKTNKPPEPHSYIISDITLEKLQQVLAANPRGTMMLKDELAGMLDFGRYSGGGGGAAERAFYLESYEGGPSTVHRIGRESIFVENNALTVFGGIQPDRLAAFKGLETDGLLQRFVTLRPPPAGISRFDVNVHNRDQMDLAIENLTRFPGRRYTASLSGSSLIRQTERDGAEYATIGDFGPGFQGFCRKLHGTHARLALILHLLISPGGDVISDETVERAAQLTRFLLAHARDFYATLPSAGLNATRDIAGWLLTKAPDRIRTSDITSSVAACKGMVHKRLTEVLDPLVTGGWLEPEEPYPSNRAWLLDLDVRVELADRAASERERRTEIRKLLHRLDGKNS